jgi:hypothetical protein
MAKGKGSRSFFKKPSCCCNQHDTACSSSKRPESYRELLNSLQVLLFYINNQSGSTAYSIDRHFKKLLRAIIQNVILRSLESLWISQEDFRDFLIFIPL